MPGCAPEPWPCLFPCLADLHATSRSGLAEVNVGGVLSLHDAYYVDPLFILNEDPLLMVVSQLDLLGLSSLSFVAAAASAAAPFCSMTSFVARRTAYLRVEMRGMCRRVWHRWREQAARHHRRHHVLPALFGIGFFWS